MDYKILYKTKTENNSLHPAVMEWLKDNLETLRSHSQTEWTGAEDETFQELHDVFNKASFKEAFYDERCTLRFIRKNNPDGTPNTNWMSRAAGSSTRHGPTPGNCRSVIRIYETSMDSGDRLKY